MNEFASVAVVDRRGWVLMQERDEHPLIDPGCWGLPGGSLEAGETPEQAAHRELAEETGLRVPSLTAVGALDVDHPVVGPHVCHLFAAHLDVTDADVTCGEGRQMVLVDPARVPELPLTVSARLAWPTLLAPPVLVGVAR